MTVLPKVNPASAKEVDNPILIFLELICTEFGSRVGTCEFPGDSSGL